MHPKSSYQVAPNWWLIGKMTMTWQFADMTSSSNVFDGFLFFLSSLVTGPRFMSISSLVLEVHVNNITGSGVMTIFFYKDWPEIRKSEIAPSEFCSIFGDWGELGIPNLAQMFFNEMLLNSAKCQSYSFYHFWVNKVKPTGGLKLPLPPRLGWKFEYHTSFFSNMKLHINNQKILLAMD